MARERAEQWERRKDAESEALGRMQREEQRRLATQRPAGAAVRRDVDHEGEFDPRNPPRHGRRAAAPRLSEYPYDTRQQQYQQHQGRSMEEEDEREAHARHQHAMQQRAYAQRQQHEQQQGGGGGGGGDSRREQLLRQMQGRQMRPPQGGGQQHHQQHDDGGGRDDEEMEYRRQMYARQQRAEQMEQMERQSRGGGGCGDFVPSRAFQGPRPGYVFKSGDRGTGYYADMVSARQRSREAESAESNQGVSLVSFLYIYIYE